MSISISLVQQTATASSTPSVTRTLNSVAQGDLLVVQFASGANIAQVSITDNNGNLWQIAQSTTVGSETVGIAYASNVNAGNTTVTMANSISQPIEGNLVEYAQSGVPGGMLVLDQVAAATGNSTSPSSGNVTTTANNEVLIGMIFATAGGITVGSGWTGNTNFLTTIFPEYQIATSTGTFAATATCTSGNWAAVCATFLIFIPIFNTLAGRFNSSNVLVGNLTVPIWHGINVTPVTVSANVTTDQNLMSYIVPANTLNSVGRTLRLVAKGVYTTPAASTATLEVKVILGSLTLIDIVTTANAGSVTNNGFRLEADIITQTAGSSAKFESSGFLTVDLGATTATACSTFIDTNTGVSSTQDSTVNQTLQVTIAFSAGSASNSATERQLILYTVG